MQKRKKPYLMASAVASALALSSVFAWMIADRAALLEDGREVVLKSQPVDPRDLLRGQYVRLNYGISQIPVSLSTLRSDELVATGATVYVQLKTGEDGYARATSVTIGNAAPSGNADAVWIRGRNLYATGSSGIMTIEYGLERFFTPETVAPEIESRMREGAITEIVIAVGGNGRAQIKGLRQEGVTLYTERLY